MAPAIVANVAGEVDVSLEVGVAAQIITLLSDAARWRAFLRILAQATVIFSNRILITRGNDVRLAGAGVCGGALALQLKLKLVNGVEDFVVHLFDHCGIASEAAGVEALHLSREIGDLF